MTTAAVITGAGRGVGREIARALAARGVQVHVTDLDAEAADAVAAELGPGAFATALDVSDPEACRRVAQATVERAGSLDVWVNNAGILRAGPCWDQPDDDRRLMVDVNAHGVMNGTLAALEPMRRAGRGNVINVISLAGLVAAPGQTLYSAGKHAALAFSVGAHFDLRKAGLRHVHVSALCPDGIRTPMIDSLAHDPASSSSWSGTLLEAPDVARAAVAFVDRPRPVVSMPRRRGLAVRIFAAFPRFGLLIEPLVSAQARRRQRAHAARTPGGAG